MSKYYPNAEWPIEELDYLVLIDDKYKVRLEVEDHCNPKGYFIGPILESVGGDYPIETLEKIKSMLMHGSLYHLLENLCNSENERNNTVPHKLTLNVDTWAPPPPLPGFYDPNKESGDGIPF